MKLSKILIKNRILNTKLTYTIILLFVNLYFGSCQLNRINTDSASFPGGQKELKSYIKKNLDWQQGQITLEGKVYISFTVNEDGSINEVSLMKGLCAPCDQAALDLVKNMPKWVPASENGKPIKSELIIPIDFKLD
ncbi:hypothetical protein C9994_09305 [Marivirga lumbricoides]|uniref:TonB C-terminal domain-containing protein n=1 Tax=Marivirga lumbricoides TaxID=1046115 RepID=A0A2T4DQC2_9BACT|nr:hypothetical protein C9994_09305 [Marivirga lumbricoides]